MDQLPPEVNQQLQQLQSLSGQLQVLGPQLNQMKAMKSEADKALEALGSLSDDAPIYRNVGALMVKEDSRQDALKRLSEEAETLELRINRLEKQEAELKEQAQQLQTKVQEALQAN